MIQNSTAGVARMQHSSIGNTSIGGSVLAYLDNNNNNKQFLNESQDTFPNFGMIQESSEFGVANGDPFTFKSHITEMEGKKNNNLKIRDDSLGITTETDNMGQVSSLRKTVTKTEQKNINATNPGESSE